MPFFGKRRERSNSHNVKPAVYDNSPPPPYQYQYSQQPAEVYQHYPIDPYASQYALTPTNYLPPHPPHRRNENAPQAYTSCTNLVPMASSCPIYNRTAEYWNSIGDKFSDVISLIDEEVFPSQHEVIFTFDQNTFLPPQHTIYLNPHHSDMSSSHRSLIQLPPTKPPRPKKASPQPTRINVLSKVSLYANSRLPASLPPLHLYTPTYPILCLAAQYSNTAYQPPSSLSRSESTSYIAANTRLGTKAMILKSIPLDSMNTIIFAIRGTSLLSPRDWNINWHTSPILPTAFLDDPGNLCHRGFLKVARAMIKPIATRLRALLQENPSRASCSLVITGHSAGGAVASLLYAHMMSTSSAARSELNNLTGCFKRVHCVTFGAPPISLLPLAKPPERRFQKSIFLSFVNEGDPVPRAEKAYVLSLMQLLAAPSPRGVFEQRWRVPEGTLCCAGRVVVLRVPRGKREEDVTASVVSEEQLRGVVWGDLPVHAMEVYARRVEALAIRRVTGKG
jgi:hypothetical protein